MSNISKIQLPNGNNYDLKDKNVASVLDRGAKNLIDIQIPNQDESNVQSTNLSNGGVQLDCTNLAYAEYSMYDVTVEINKRYKLVFIVDEYTGSGTFNCILKKTDSSGETITQINITSTGVYEYDFTADVDSVWIGIYLNNSATPVTASAKVRAMLCTYADYEVSSIYQPYAPTNRELWVMVEDIISTVLEEVL